MTVEVSDAGRSPHHSHPGKLPPAPMLPKQYNQWRKSYGSGGQVDSRGLRIWVPESQSTQFSSLQDCRDAAAQLRGALLNWFDQTEFWQLRASLQDTIARDESACFVWCCKL